MRIAFFTYADPAEAGGVQEYTYQLSRALEKRGNTVTIFGPEGKLLLPYHNYRAVCRKVKVPAPNGNWTTTTLPFATQPSTAEIINRGGFDLLHIQDPWVPFVGYDLIGNVKIPKVATINTGWESTSAVAGIMKFILPMFKEVALKSNIGVIFVSKHVQNCWRSLIGKKIKQKIIYHGIDPDFQTNIRQPATRQSARLLFVGRLVKRKGLRYALEALADLVKEYPGLSLDVLGKGAELKKLKLMMKQNHLTRHVNFYGQIAGTDRIAYFRKAQIFCAPYADEGFPLTILEAMAAGLPIAGFANRGALEALKNYPGGELLVKAGSGRALAAAIRKLLQEPLLQIKLRRWLIRESRKYSWEKAAAATEKFYFEILDRGEQYTSFAL